MRNRLYVYGLVWALWSPVSVENTKWSGLNFRFHLGGNSIRYFVYTKQPYRYEWADDVFFFSFWLFSKGVALASALFSWLVQHAMLSEKVQFDISFGQINDSCVCSKLRNGPSTMTPEFVSFDLEFIVSVFDVRSMFHMNFVFGQWRTILSRIHFPSLPKTNSKIIYYYDIAGYTWILETWYHFLSLPRCRRLWNRIQPKTILLKSLK